MFKLKLSNKLKKDNDTKEARADEKETREKTPLLSPFISLDSVPSKWISYPKWSIRIRKYKYGELDTFSNSTMSEMDKINFVLNGVDTTFDIDELYASDFIYIAFMRKLFTLGLDGTTYNVSVKCNKCDEYFVFQIDSTKIEYKELEVPELPLIFTFKDGTVFEMTPHTIGNIKFLYEHGYKDNGIAELAVCVRNLEFEEALEIIKNTDDAIDTEGLGRVSEIFDYGLAPVRTICPNKIAINDETVTCGNVMLVQLDVEKEDIFIYPFREPSSSFRDPISFGSKGSDRPL